MDRLKRIKYLLLSLFVGMIGGSVIVLLKNGFNDTTGNMADWLSGIGTVGTLFAAYIEIKDSRRQFDKEHRPELKVYANWKKPFNIEINENIEGGNADVNSGIFLNIIPVNKGLASGIYRYFGVCRLEDVDEIVSLVNKAENGNLKYAKADKLLDLICYDPEDVGQTKEHHDTKITSLLYPNKKRIFQTIEPDGVGDILNKGERKIEKKFKIDISEDKLAVLYIDPQMKIYSFEVGVYREENKNRIK